VKRTYSVSTLLSLTTGAMIMVLVAVFAVDANNAWQSERTSAKIAASARVSRDIVSVREALRAELGVIDTTIAEPRIADAATLERLKRLHGQTLEAMRNIQREIAQLGANVVPPEFARKIAGGMTEFNNRVFPAVLKAALLPRERRPRHLLVDPQKTVYATLDRVDEQAMTLSREIAGTGAYMSEMIRVSDIAWRVRVDAGGERREYANLISWPHKPSQAERDSLIKIRGRTEAPWQSIEKSLKNSDMPSPMKLSIARARSEYFGRYSKLRAQVLEAMEKGETLDISGPRWLELSTPALNSLMEVSRAGLAASEAHSMLHLVEARRDLKVALLQMGICITLAFFTAFLVLSRVIRPLKQITRAITNNENADIERVLAISARGDEIGRFAGALKTFRKMSEDRQRLERELLQNQVARETAEVASKVKSEFLANMSHELRTPLNAVIGFSEMMMHGTFGPLSERYLEYAKLINTSGGHLLSLVTDILDLAKIEAGRFQADFRDFDLKACVEDCIPLIAPKARERAITVSAELPGQPLMVVADPRACKQILINLLSNAVKFSQEKGVITVALKELGETVQFSVTDEGVGIPADLLERIGQPFEQATNNPHVAREGTGLGLSLVKALVGEHGGKMAVESREDAGTIVTITLPRQQERRKIQRAA
jgi:signal transduction histidine kinase